jgi:hypothetical protein
MFRVNRKDIHYLRTTIEAYDGMAVVRTVERSGDRRSLRRRVDATEATIELLIAPGCENLISKLLTSLKEKEGIPLQAVAASSKG